MSTTHRKRLAPIKNFALLAGSLIVALLLAELLLRLIGYSHVVFYEPSVCCGSALIPNAEGWWRQEGQAYIRINSRGLRDREHAIAKPPNSLRIAILGDSYAEAFQVPMEQSFWSVLGKRLAHCPTLSTRPIEVINFGVAGYGTAQALQTLRYKARSYNPDIVLLAFVTGNDVRNNSRVLDGANSRPYFIYKDGNLVLDDTFLQDPQWRSRNSTWVRFVVAVINHSRVLQLLYQLKSGMTRLIPNAQADDRPAQAPVYQEPGLDNAIYRPPGTKSWQDAWTVTEALIERIKDEAHTQRADLLLVTLSNGIQVHPDPKTRDAFKVQLGVDTLFYPERRLTALSDRLGLSLLVLAPRLQQWAETHQTCVHGFANGTECGGHWNATGHRLAGQWIADTICQMKAH